LTKQLFSKIQISGSLPVARSKNSTALARSGDPALGTVNQRRLGKQMNNQR
jgi:hypothetical protein